MANQTVIVLSNNHLHEIRHDPRFGEELLSAIDETVSSGKPARIGANYGTVMPAHHGYDPTLYLSYGGVLKEIGSTTLTELPRGRVEYIRVAQTILGNA